MGTSSIGEIEELHGFEECAQCDGTGLVYRLSKDTVEVCSKCGGSRLAHHGPDTGYESIADEDSDTECPRCKGYGSVKVSCALCGGSGSVVVTEEIDVTPET